MNLIKIILKYFYHQIVFLAGYCHFILTGKKSDRAFQAMISLFCTDGGWTNNFYTALLRLFKKPYFIPNANGIFGNLDADKLKIIQQELDSKGYYTAEVLVPEDLCQQLESLSANTISYPFRNSPEEKSPPPQLYKPESLISSRYSFICEDLADNKIIQDIMADPSLMAVANSYFRGRPILDSVIMSISTDFSQKPNADAAQLFHFDMDRIKWLKFFLYLSDVNEQSGPHVFVEGTHQRGGIPKPLLKRGYARIEDYEVSEIFEKEKIKVFKCRRGTIFVEDTRGLHKGQVLTKGHRLLLQVQYNLGHFGTTDLKPHRIKDIKSEKLKKMINKFPDLYSNFIFS